MEVAAPELVWVCLEWQHQVECMGYSPLAFLRVVVNLVWVFLAVREVLVTKVVVEQQAAVYETLRQVVPMV